MQLQPFGKYRNSGKSYIGFSKNRHGPLGALFFRADLVMDQSLELSGQSGGGQWSVEWSVSGMGG